MTYSYLGRVFAELDWLEAERRSRLSDAERAAEESRERWARVRDGCLLAGALAVSVGLTVVPWTLGLVVMGRGAARLGRRRSRPG